MSSVDLSTATTRALLPLYHTLVAARRIDELERQFTNRGEAFFHVAGFGHGATAALAPHLGTQDWLHCHYRDKALMLARGIAAEDFFLALFCKNDSHSRGRQMSAHMSAPSLNVLSVVGPVGNNALQAAGIASAVKERNGQPVVVCCVGDGTTQEGEVLEAIAESVRSHLPVLWLVEDNYFAISTRTAGKTFYSLPTGLADEFMGIPIHYLDGSSVQSCYAVFGSMVQRARENRAPVIAVLRTERLDDHTNADDQAVYRSAEEIASAAGTGDPLAVLASDLLQLGVTQQELDEITSTAREEVNAAAERAKRAAEPTACMDAKPPLPRIAAPALAEPAPPVDGPLTMLEAMRRTLRAQLAANQDVILYGQDIDDPKGDVFGLTRGLGTAFPEQVENSPLSESTIIGVSIGRALAGKRPVAFLQFADFIPLAFNQIAAELASIYWRTDGGWQAPVIVMAVCGGYKAGLGPFHAQTLESVVAHIPGLDVIMPSNAEDAAGLLNAAFASRRPTIFLYPKSCLNDRSLATRELPEHLIVPLGSARVMRRGTEVTILGWGGTVPLCTAAAQHLHAVGVSAEVIDLRCISPWDAATVISSVERTGNLIVVHEDNRSVGFGAEVCATIAEKASRQVHMRRVTRADTHIPCNFGNQLEVLPSAAAIVEAAAELLDLDVEPAAAHAVETDPHLYVVEAFGTSPSDEQLTILQWFVEVGKEIKVGDTIAEVEADKAAGELDAPVSGCVEKILVSAGDMVRIGTPLISIRTPEPRTSGLGQMHIPNRPLPVVKRRVLPQDIVRREIPSMQNPEIIDPRRSTAVFLSRVYTAQGSQTTTNADLAARFPELTEEDILRKIGIVSRCRAAKGETAFTLAMKAVDACYDADPSAFQHLDLIVCATSSVSQVCPSIACSILAELNHRLPACRAPAFDVLATCTGFLYALQIAHGLIKASPQSRALVVTAETLSSLLDPTNAATCIGFGDAATACIVGGQSFAQSAPFEVLRPSVHAKGDQENALTVPPIGTGEYIQLEGRHVRQESIPALSESLREVCRAHGILPTDLRYVVAHQANQRILNDLGVDLGVAPEKVFSNIRMLGNTSSSTIPLCLRDLVNSAELHTDDLLGLTAFGGGYTYGAALLKVNAACGHT
ncbi:MAG: thiamine pyrophosphate-dependent enzyme [Candidatus Sumerlaeaceae bacterium]